MQKESFKINCFIEIGSVTQAMKAQKALSTSAIPSAVIKKESYRRAIGCVYGLDISCRQLGNARAVLEASKIPFRVWNDS
jgi:hypothetical protein